MCGNSNGMLPEGTSLDELDRAIDRLAHELTCLIDLGVLTSEEDAVFSEFLEDLWKLAVRARGMDMPGNGDRLSAKRCRHELTRMIMMLSGDLNFAYQRLGFAA